MAIEVSEAVDNQDYKKTATVVTFSQKYFVTGAGSVYQATLAVGIPNVGDFYVDTDLTDPEVPVLTPTVIPCINVRCTNINSTDNIHEITADYEFSVNDSTGGSGTAPENPVDGDEFWTIASTSDTAHVNASPDGFITAQYPGSAPDNNGLIGVQSDGEINGVDIVDEFYTINVTLYKTAADVNDTYINTINNLKGSVNAVAWYGAPAFASLYKNFRVGDHNSTLKIIEFEFLVGKNKIQSQLTGFKNKLGNVIAITGGKYAHQYIWNRSAETTTGGVTKTYSTGVYVDTPYLPLAWTGLGLTGNLINP